MPWAPHEYIVRRNVDNDKFVAFVKLIREQGERRKWGRYRNTCLDSRRMELRDDGRADSDHDHHQPGAHWRAAWGSAAEETQEAEEAEAGAAGDLGVIPKSAEDPPLPVASQKSACLLGIVVRPGGFELPTFWFAGKQSKILSAASGVAYRGTRHLSRP
jgi:hypothetical protein